MIHLEPYKPGGYSRPLDNEGFPGYRIDLYGNVYDETNKIALTLLDGVTWKVSMKPADGKRCWVTIDRLGAKVFWDMDISEIKSRAPDMPKRLLSAIAEAKSFKMLSVNDRKYLRDIPYLDDYEDTKDGVYVVTRYGDIWNEVRLQKVASSRGPSGYPVVSVLHDEKYARGQSCARPIKVAWLVALAFVPLPDGFSGNPRKILEIHHKGTNIQNNRWDNLVWCMNHSEHLNTYHQERPRRNS